jgi:hypothetical protein
VSALILPAAGLRTERRSLFRAPAIIGRRGDPQPPAPVEPILDIHRQPLRFAADWQLAIAETCRQHRILCRPVFDFLQDSGLLSRCLYLSSTGRDEPLLFKYIGVPTRICLGDDWARENLGKPDSAPADRLADGIAAQYVEAIEGGQPVLNRVFSTEVFPDRPLVFTHLLVGWRLPDGRRALLSCLDLL